MQNGLVAGACLLENNLNLLPCDGCTSIMFCRNCYETAMPEHKMICAIHEFVQSSVPVAGVFKAITLIVSAFDWNDD